MTGSPPRVGVVTFPGSLDDVDALHAITLAGGVGVPLWHKDPHLHGVDAVVLPGGFAYGDYLRAGAIARFSPVMSTLIPAARDGLPVLGICNGFQILCEAHLLPGALTRNAGLTFYCRHETLRIENASTTWTSDFSVGNEVTIVLKNGEGRYQADRATLDTLAAEGRIVARYLDNPNGSADDIAGICNDSGTIVGLMPHPEHAVEDPFGPGTDGLGIFTSLVANVLSSTILGSTMASSSGRL